MNIEIFGLVMLEGLACQTPIAGGGIKLGKVFITSDKGLLEAFLTKTGSEATGKLITDTIRQVVRSEHNQLFAFFAENELDESSEEAVLVDVLPNIFASVMPFTIALWLIRDLSVMLRLGITLSAEETKLEARRLRLEFPGLTSYNASGQLADTTFTEQELVLAANNCIAALNTGSKVPDQHRGEYRQSLAAFNRLNRVWHNLIAARAEYILPYRIVHYVTVMEALLSRDTEELSHKIGERAALILGNSGAERQRVYGRVKQAYTHRSKFVHGEQKKKHPDVYWAELSRDCDNYVRKLVAMHDGKCVYPELFETEDSGELNAYFLNRLFPIASDCADSS